MYFLIFSKRSVVSVENHLHDMILKTFDPKKADAIFAEEGETPSWLAELIEYPTWRSLIYRSVKAMFRIRSISDRIRIWIPVFKKTGSGSIKIL